MRHPIAEAYIFMSLAWLAMFIYQDNLIKEE